MPPNPLMGADTPVRTVPPDALAVPGDNRPNPNDSRSPQVGPVPLDRVAPVGGVPRWTPGEGLALHPFR